MKRKDYISEIVPSTLPKVEIKSTRVVDDLLHKVFPCDGLRLVDCTAVINNPNTPIEVKAIIQNNYLNTPPDNEFYCDDLDMACELTFNPALQYGEEVEYMCDHVEKYIRDITNYK